MEGHPEGRIMAARAVFGSAVRLACVLDQAQAEIERYTHNPSRRKVSDELPSDLNSHPSQGGSVDPAPRKSDSNQKNDKSDEILKHSSSLGVHP
jgi:hypothetical protein